MALEKLPQAGITPARDRNLVINGNFDIWQRGTSNSAAAGSQRYLADRWATNAVASTIANSQQAFGIQTNVPNNPRYFNRSVVVSSAGASNYANLYTSIEDVTLTGGLQVTVSFWAKADTTRPIAVEFVQSFGSGGGSDVTGIGVTQFTLTTTWQRFTAVVTIPAIVATVSSTIETSYLRLNFWFDAGSSFNSRTASLGQQSGTFDIAQVQVEYGAAASNFERLPIGDTWRLCQRYYQKLGGVSGALRGYMYSGGVDQVYVNVELLTKMRTTPTATKVGTWTTTNISGQPSIPVVTDSSFVLNATMGSTGVATFYCADATTYVTIDAEF